MTPLAVAQRALWLKDVFVRECYARIDESYMPFEGITEEIDVQTKIQATHHRVVTRQLDESEVASDGDTERQIVEFKVLAAARFVAEDADDAADPDVDQDADQDDRFGEVVAVFSAVYFMMEPVDEATLVEFGMRNATFHVWPYWRELLHSTTGRLRLPPTVLPMFKIAPIEDKPKSDSSDAADRRVEQDDVQVNLNERYEVAYWTSAFGVSERELREAVARVGVSAKHLRAELPKVTQGSESGGPQ